MNGRKVELPLRREDQAAENQANDFIELLREGAERLARPGDDQAAKLDRAVRSLSPELFDRLAEEGKRILGCGGGCGRFEPRNGVSVGGLPGKPTFWFRAKRGFVLFRFWPENASSEQRTLLPMDFAVVGTLGALSGRRLYDLAEIETEMGKTISIGRKRREIPVSATDIVTGKRDVIAVRLRHENGGWNVTFGPIAARNAMCPERPEESEQV